MPRFATKPLACEGCPAFEKGLGYVPADGTADATIAFIGQGPGWDEASSSVPRPFIGPSGRHLFDGWAARAGIPRTSSYVDNTVRCYLVKQDRSGRPVRKRGGKYEDRTPTLAEQQFCWRRHVGVPLTRLADEGQLRLVVAVGVPAATFLHDKSYSIRLAGSFYPLELPNVTDEA